MNSQPEWQDYDLADVLRILRSAMVEARVPQSKIRRTFAVMKKQAAFGEPLRVETAKINNN